MKGDIIKFLHVCSHWYRCTALLGATCTMTAWKATCTSDDGSVRDGDSEVNVFVEECKLALARNRSQAYRLNMRFVGSAFRIVCPMIERELTEGAQWNQQIRMKVNDFVL